jgi:hypothetical protein
MRKALLAAAALGLLGASGWIGPAVTAAEAQAVAMHAPPGLRARHVHSHAVHHRRVNRRAVRHPAPYYRPQYATPYYVPGPLWPLFPFGWERHYLD